MPSTSSSRMKRALFLAAAACLAFTATSNAPCSLPINNHHYRGGGDGNSGKGGNNCACPLYGGGPRGAYFQCSATKASKGHYISHNAPLASFRQPRESLEKLKGVARGVKGHVGTAVGGVKRKWAEHRAARRAAREELLEQVEGGSGSGKQAPKKKGGGLFRLGGDPPGKRGEEEDEAEESAPGQDLQHMHEHPQQTSHPHPRYHHYSPAHGHSTPSPLDADDLGAALVVLGRTQAYDAAALLRAEMGQPRPRLPLRRRALTYGHWAVDLLGYGIKLVAILLFQILGAALVVNEYNNTGLVSSTLLRFSGLLAGLAFLPPLAVALRESLPSHARNPLVRGVAPVLQMAMDVLSVGSLALLGSILLTAVAALPGLHDALLSYQLGEEFIKGALSAGVVMTFVWGVAKAFEPVATKWFV